VSFRDLRIDPGMLRSFAVAETKDPRELDTKSKISDRLPELSRTYKYRLRDRALLHMNFNGPICSLASRESGSIVASYGADRFAMDISMDGDDRNPVVFTTMLHGTMTLVRGGEVTTSSTDQGLVFRPEPDTRLLTSNDNARASIFIRAAELESALEHMLDDRLRRPLEFARVVDWNRGLAASLKQQIDFVMHEFNRSDGIANNPVAMASLTDLLVSLVLSGVPHNYVNRLDTNGNGVIPAYVRRAEEFMRVNAGTPIRMTEVAAMAGCSVRTLGVVFRRFRGTTPLRALQAIRLEQAHAELNLGTEGGSIATIARRYGFTNAARFSNAYRRRFTETVAETVRRSMLRG
jgi:AraC-like DNA-binding protein